jgi:hypothetical protein
MGAAREKDQADFDLERFMDMFDEAINSKDERVMNALRSLMMIVTLTRPESRDSGVHGRNAGPLRRLYEDVNHLNRRLHDVEDTVRRMQRPAMEQKEYSWTDHEMYSMATASKMAQQIDQDLTNTLKIKAKGLYHK